MGVLIANTTGESLKIRDFFVTDASRGWGYYGDIEYILTPNGNLLLRNSIFTRQTMKELKPLEVHIIVDREKRLVLHHDDFEKYEAIVFVTENEGKLGINVVPRKAEGGFADRIRGMLSSRGSAVNTEALIAAAKPLKAKNLNHTT